MLERTQDFNFLRISLADAYARRDLKDNTREQLEAVKEEIMNYLKRYTALAKESYEARKTA